MQLVAQGRVDQRREPSDPQAHLRLARAKEHAHDFLEGIALEVEEHEEGVDERGSDLVDPHAAQVSCPPPDGLPLAVLRALLLFGDGGAGQVFAGEIVELGAVAGRCVFSVPAFRAGALKLRLRLIEVRRCQRLALRGRASVA